MILNKLKNFLEKIDHYRDELLFVFIKPYWPRKIVPNHITYLRVVIGVALFILLFFFGIENKTLIVSLFCIGVLTDLFDGSVARCLDKVTAFGAMLDPLADRILILPIAIYSLYESQKWLLLILLLTEALNALALIFYKSRESEIKANIFGKTKMVLLSLVFFGILEAWPDMPSMFFIDVIWFSLIFSFLSIFLKVLELKDKGHIKNKVLTKRLNKNQYENI
ncbi:MAG: CDP-alcohol phosphatidyltransferase family protein [Candidatus Staskawiczbacteria bacterium]|nr:CDP-alcohol phosphatidyltransferase family protein [Candidatus Staskawiczbacteria bacterium]